MKKILDTVVFGEYTTEDVLIVAGVVIALLIIFRILMRVFKKQESSQYVQLADCLNCGWHGKVSKLAGRCPKCNQPLGDQKAHRPQQFLDDFKRALEDISIDVKNKGTFFQNASKRLKEFNIIKLDEQQDMPTPSPGPEDSLFQP